MSKLLQRLGLTGQRKAPLPPKPDYHLLSIDTKDEVERKSKSAGDSNRSIHDEQHQSESVKQITLCPVYSDPLDLQRELEDELYICPYPGPEDSQSSSKLLMDCSLSQDSALDLQLYDSPDDVQDGESIKSEPPPLPTSQSSKTPPSRPPQPKPRKTLNLDKEEFEEDSKASSEVADISISIVKVEVSTESIVQHLSEKSIKTNLHPEGEETLEGSKGESLDNNCDFSLIGDEEEAELMMAAVNKFHPSQQLYETAFDSHVRPGLRTFGSSAHFREKGKKEKKEENESLIYQHNLINCRESSSRRDSGNSTSFTPEPSSRSSTASSINSNTSSSSSGHGSSTSSTPQHSIKNLIYNGKSEGSNHVTVAAAPKRVNGLFSRQKSEFITTNHKPKLIHTLLGMPRSKSSDLMNLNRGVLVPSATAPAVIPENGSVVENVIRRQKIESASIRRSGYHLLRKSATSDTISSLDSNGSHLSDSDSSTRCLLGRVTRNEKYKNRLEANSHFLPNLPSVPNSLSSSSASLISSPPLLPSSASGSIRHSAPMNGNQINSESIDKELDKLVKPRGKLVKPNTLNLKCTYQDMVGGEKVPKQEQESQSPSQVKPLQSPQNDIRPQMDYDVPWDINKRLSQVVTEIINTPTRESSSMDGFSSPGSTCLGSSIDSHKSGKSGKKGETTASKLFTQLKNSVETKLKLNSPVEPKSFTPTGKDAAKTFLNGGSNKSSPTGPSPTQPPPAISSGEQVVVGKGLMGSRAGLNLNLYSLSSNESSTFSSNCSLNKSFGRRKKPLLTFSASGLISPVTEQAIDPNLVLEKQGWFHGSISRIDAENLLRKSREGSYLIRNCESTKNDYSLSLKSAKGFMHMKIVREVNGGYILGVFSKPFPSIPEMVHHYTINKLPIRGAEHMSLRYPLIDQLL